MRYFSLLIFDMLSTSPQQFSVAGRSNNIDPWWGRASGRRWYKLCFFISERTKREKERRGCESADDKVFSLLTRLSSFCATSYSRTTTHRMLCETIGWDRKFSSTLRTHGCGHCHETVWISERSTWAATCRWMSARWGKFWSNTLGYPACNEPKREIHANTNHRRWKNVVESGRFSHIPGKYYKVYEITGSAEEQRWRDEDSCGEIPPKTQTFIVHGGVAEAKGFRRRCCAGCCGTGKRENFCFSSLSRINSDDANKSRDLCCCMLFEAFAT